MENLSRTEELLDVLLNGTELPETKPQSRIEEKLHALCEKGLGGGGGEEWVKIADITTEEAVHEILISENIPTNICEVYIRANLGLAESTTYNYFTFTINGKDFLCSNISALTTQQNYNNHLKILNDGTGFVYRMQAATNYATTNMSTSSNGINGNRTDLNEIKTIGVYASAPTGLLASGAKFEVYAKVRK